jgi:predicted nucleic acid-binding protein
VFRVVFDTVVFVRALINSRSICGRLVLDFPDRYRLFLSRQVLQEILEVLARRELLDRLKLRGIDYRKALEKLMDAMTGAETVELANIAAFRGIRRTTSFWQPPRLREVISSSPKIRTCWCFATTKVQQSSTQQPS